MVERYEYTVKCIRPNVYEVYKFEEGSSRPVTTYTLTTFDSKFKCNCMSGRYRHYCAHHDMVKEYRKIERARVENPSMPMAMITFRK